MYAFSLIFTGIVNRLSKDQYVLFFWKCVNRVVNVYCSLCLDKWLSRRWMCFKVEVVFREMTLNFCKMHMLLTGVLSALYLGGFQHVYIHVDREPTGRWWQSLKTENITVLTLQRPNFVYQQKLLLITHFSDVSR